AVAPKSYVGVLGRELFRAFELVVVVDAQRRSVFFEHPEGLVGEPRNVAELERALRAFGKRGEERFEACVVAPKERGQLVENDAELRFELAEKTEHEPEGIRRYGEPLAVRDRLAVPSD